MASGTRHNAGGGGRSNGRCDAGSNLPHRNMITLNWDASPSGAAVLGTASILSALAPLLTVLRFHCVGLESWAAVDAAHIQAIAGIMPGLELLSFHTCHVTSKAWLQMQTLSACSQRAPQVSAPKTYPISP